MDIYNLIFSLVSAVIGTFLGAYLLHLFQINKYRNLHKIAIKALDILEKYDSFSKAENEFNNKMSVAEKRAVLVALQKLGVPFDLLSSPTFSIRKISFLKQDVLKDELEQMKEQINKGNCDTLFHQDVESSFLSNIKLTAVRNSAKKYVDLVLRKSKFINGQLIEPFPPIQVLTFGELTTNAVFRARIDYAGSFDKVGEPIEEKLNTLVRDIDFGYYDTLLFWDFESYLNLKSQNNMTSIMLNSMGKNQ